MGIIEQIRSDKSRCNFIKDTDLPEIIKENRLQQVLVRCGNGRFICSAQDVTHFVSIIEKEKSDYIRDVSLFGN